MIENEHDEVDHQLGRPSKSARKREAIAVQEFGRKLVALKVEAIEKLPLEDNIKQALIAAKSMKRGALKRQIQYIGKLLRSVDNLDEILGPLR